jgi:hypothetical protein
MGICISIIERIQGSLHEVILARFDYKIILVSRRDCRKADFFKGSRAMHNVVVSIGLIQYFVQ